MTKTTKTQDELERLIDTETEESEKHRDEPMVAGKRRPGTRMQVYSIRLAPEDIAEIERVAAEQGVPARALVQRWVHEGLAAHRPDSPAVIVDRITGDVDRLRRLVS